MRAYQSSNINSQFATAFCMCALAMLMPGSLALAQQTSLISVETIIKILSKPYMPGGMGLGGIVFPPISFRYNSTQLADAFSRRQLEEVKTALASDKLRPYRFEIGGYTDSRGSAAYNLRLSKRRALKVRKSLCQTPRVECGNLKPQGYGKTSLLVSDETPRGQTLNRRVVIKRLD